MDDPSPLTEGGGARYSIQLNEMMSEALANASLTRDTVERASSEREERRRMSATREDASTAQRVMLEQMQELQREVFLLRQATANNRPAAEQGSGAEKNFFSFKGARDVAAEVGKASETSRGNAGGGDRLHSWSAD